MILRRKENEITHLEVASLVGAFLLEAEHFTDGCTLASVRFTGRGDKLEIIIIITISIINRTI